MAQLSVTFLGTGASWPTAERGLSSVAVKRGGEILLFDCGEGTQRQLQKSELSYQQITHIFLSHYHGDHCFGVPGLIKTMALNERDRPLSLYGPRGLTRMVDAFRRMGGWTRDYDISTTEVAPGDTMEMDGYRVEVHQTDHSIDNVAYVLQEATRPGRFDRPKAIELGVPVGPLFGRLQRGQAVDLPDGRTISPDQVLGPGRRGRRIVYSGDTQPCASLVEAARGADLFICEATFTHDLVDRAREVRHMTAREAAETASQAGVQQLAITHISPRYKDAESVLDEARAAFPATVLAQDLMSLEVPLP